MTGTADHRLPGGPGAADPFVVGPAVLGRGELGGPLSGRRFAVKDLLEVAGTRTGAGNPAYLEDAPVAGAHAPPVAALLAAGADLLGKTVTDELAFSLSGTNVHYGTPPNPAAPGRVPGGSSSGSASAVASGAVELAIGTDTGGSVRVPASYCGIYGLRTSHGRVDRRGAFLLAPSFCTVGLLAGSGAVLAAGWRAFAEGATDPSWQRRPARPVRGLVLVPELSGLADPSCHLGAAAAAERLAALLEVPLAVGSLGGPAALARYLDAFRALQLAEAWGRHGAWIAERRPELGPGISARFAAAAEIGGEEVAAARAVREELRREMDRLLGPDRYLVQPAASGPAPPVSLEGPVKDDLRRRTLTLTAPAGLAGAPVVSLPVLRDGGLPVGLALVGLPGDDDALVEVAARSGEL